MILPVRPHFIFDKTPQNSRLVTLPIPSRNAGSPNLLETFILLAVGRIVNPKRIFEIGTFTGQTTRNLALNFPEAEILTLDLDPSHAARLAAEHPQAATLAKITQLQGHSMSFDFSPWYESCELVFVDGGHDYATVKADSETALKLLIAPRSPSAIVWHDYANPQFPDVSKYLLSINLTVYHVEETQMAVYFTP